MLLPTCSPWSVKGQHLTCIRLFTGQRRQSVLRVTTRVRPLREPAATERHRALLVGRLHIRHFSGGKNYGTTETGTTREAGGAETGATREAGGTETGTTREEREAETGATREACWIWGAGLTEVHGLTGQSLRRDPKHHDIMRDSAVAGALEKGRPTGQRLGHLGRYAGQVCRHLLGKLIRIPLAAPPVSLRRCSAQRTT